MAHGITTPIPSIHGYQILNLLNQGRHTAVYRAFSEKRQQTVVLKVLNSSSPSLRELVKFRNQYTLTKNLEIQGVVKPLGFEQWQNTCLLVMEDHEALSLKQYCHHQTLDCLSVLKLGIQLAEILHHLCKTRIIHKDIKPANILIDPKTQKIRLIDFSIASLLPKEHQELQSPNELEGTLAYLAPEQTGRMNRGVDYRADFYSLGVTLYELLTGQLPFLTRDLMELVHFHMAKVPRSPHEVNPKVPTLVSDLVLKLMAKNAEDRYQSALGLKHDLERCLDQLTEQGNIEDFELGQRDICDRFLIPERLYGRDTEVQSLLDAFERVAQGSSELMLVAGFSGIGKTAVVNEVHKPITRQKGYFIQGKFDQFNRNIPFSAFVQAFRRLMTQLLGESDTKLATWKAKILQAVGDSGQVLIEVIPELEIILGSQPAVPELVGNAAQNRFNLLFSKFIQIFTTPDHPLVIFLDDLQWADSGSLNLLKVLMGEAATGHLLVIGAYRDNEVSPAHPLMLVLKDIAEQQSQVNRITLQALKQDDLEQLLASAMLCSKAMAAPLAKLIYQKTQGNPFFSIQFLRGLYEEGHISFAESGYWQCKLEQVRRLVLTDDVVTLMVRWLQKLPTATQDVLKQAACIGNRFDLTTLAAVCDLTQDEVAADLWSALKIGLILPEGDTYKLFQQGEHPNVAPESVPVGYHFLHDRVQQAVYSLIPDSEKQITHYRIGQQLLDNLSIQQRDDKLFEIINQLNYGLSLISDSVEQRNLANLNLEVGKKAKASTAYAAASNYFSVARELLGNDSWETEYLLTLEIYQESVEAAYLNREFQQSEQLANHALTHTAILLDQIKIHVIQIQSYIAQSQLNEAIQLALTVLKLLDDNLELPEAPDQDDFKRALAETQKHMGDHSIDRLIHLPPMSDPEKLAAMEILASVAPPCYIAFPSMMPLIAMKMVKLSLLHGNAPSSAFGYAMYGFLLCGVVNDIETGYQLGQLSLDLAHHSNANAIQAKLFLLSSHFIQPWKDSIHQCIRLLPEAFRCGLESGDFEFAGYAASFYCFDAIFIGKNLDSLGDEIQTYEDVFTQYRQEYGLVSLYISQQVLLNLTQQVEQPHQLIGDRFNEHEMLPMLQRQGDRMNIAMTQISKLMLGFTFQEYEWASIAAAHAEQHLDGVVATLCVPLFYFYDSLVKLAKLTQTGESPSAAMLSKVQQNQEKMRYWSDHAPMNYLHKFYLVEAEYERVLGNKAAALEHYDHAISTAQANQYLHEEALANELAAQFYLDWGKDSIASEYMQKSYSCYSRWGARTKTEHLSKIYPQLLKSQPQATLSILSPLETLASVSTTSDTTTAHSSIRNHHSLSQALDFSTVIRSAQVLSRNLDLDLLILQLIRLTMQSSGAESCALILPPLSDSHDAETDASQVEDWEVHRLSNQSDTTDYPVESLVDQDYLPHPQMLTDCLHIPQSLIHYVKRTAEAIHIDRFQQKPFHITDEYLIKHQPQSVLVQPILHQGDVIGVLYLENRLTAQVFNSTQQTVIGFFCNQAGIALENAKLYRKQARYAQALEAKNQQLEIAKQAAESANRAKSNFLDNISHELRTPLNGVLGYAQILKRSQTLAPKDFHDVNIIHQCGTHLLALINDVLDISKIEAHKLELSPIDIHLSSLLQSVVEMCRVKAEFKDLRLIYHPCRALPDSVYVDAKRLRQVLINLLSNAIKFTDHGMVTLNVKALSLDDQQLSILFQIIDTGVGIDTEDCQKLFQAFEQVGDLNRQAQGTGLGLAISQKIVQLMGSSIEVRSRLGQGSDFSFTLDLPLSEAWTLEQQSLNVGSHHQITGYQGNRRQILIVNDHWETREVLSNLLNPLGFNVIEIDNAKAGLEFLYKNPIDLVILDATMSGKDGVEMLQVIRNSESLADLKIIILSNADAQLNVKPKLDDSKHLFLNKPFNSNELLQLLEQQLDLIWNDEATSLMNIDTPFDEVTSEGIQVLVPPSAELQELLGLVSSGLLRNFRQQLEDLVQQEPQYAIFAKPMLHLAQQFKIEEVEEMLKTHLALTSGGQ